MTAQGNLFANLPPPADKPITFLRSERPLWTENKAKLIERYLFYFVLITRHGACIDGFAGPQRANALGSWAAKLVLESEPKFLREFWLCELNPKRVAALQAMVRSQDPIKGRNISVISGDFNQTVDLILSQCNIKDATAILLAERFKKELGYAHAFPWPIYKKGRGQGRLMFHMVHATDHPAAPRVMHRAYFNATKVREPVEQIEMDLGKLQSQARPR